ncbi:serine hydrolase domain-containing protein [Sphingobium nicotianae]|uniref:Beta-lactamase family protein n=1 Tax=Sphingobium nicotianae TaxID=2782607 RepID=A0A9X1DBQ4_9SPHN|nr:serine hydrolase [Sphingobium nicotianae]MBT2187042.1 beta-lactamase family protein [Sphingobium nicotianae]
MRRIARLTLPMALLAAQGSPVPAQPATPAPSTTSPSPAVIAMRREWLNPAINSFTFRDNARMFDTRPVRRAGPVWQLPRATGFTMPPGYDAWAEHSYTNALLVIRDGKILFEDYRNRSDASTRFISFSMAKSITSMLLGIALDKGMIRSIDDPVTAYVPELKGGGYDGVTLRHILQMRSGVDYEERYDFGAHPSPAAINHENAIVLNKVRFADSARTIGHKWEQGTHFNYATIDTAVLGWALERATKQPLAAFMQANLWGPLGAEADGYWIADGPAGVGRELSGMGYNATLRDFGRLGMLMLAGGKRGKVQIVPASWMRQATTMLPTGVDARPGYGLQFWQVDDEPGAFAAVGLAGQMIYVHPATRTVIVKLSYHPPDVPPQVNAETIRYFRAITAQR